MEIRKIAREDPETFSDAFRFIINLTSGDIYLWNSTKLMHAAVLYSLHLSRVDNKFIFGQKDIFT